ncbi:hypothetical protein [Cellulomonas sp. URHB0016]
MRRYPALHLLWSLPITCAAGFAAWLVADLALCGISGCTGGGFGVDDADRLYVLPFLLASALVAPVPVAVVPWTTRGRRVAVYLAVAFGIFALTGVRMLWILSNAAAPASS